MSKDCNIAQIVNLLVSHGNTATYTVRPHDGYEYRMSKPIDFLLLRDFFGDFPKNLSVNENDDVIHDFDIWCTVRGPGYREPSR